MEIKQPTLNEAVEHMKKNGGHLTAKKHGVTWQEDEAVPTAEDLI